MIWQRLVRDIAVDLFFDGSLVRRAMRLFAAFLSAFGRRGKSFLLLMILLVGRRLALLGVPQVRRILLTGDLAGWSRLTRFTASWRCSTSRTGDVDGSRIRVSGAWPLRSVLLNFVYQVLVDLYQAKAHLLAYRIDRSKALRAN